MKRAFRSAVVAVAVLANAGAVTACGPRPGRHELEIRELAFPAPPEGVRAGDTLVWVNSDLVPHTVSAEGVWESGALSCGHIKEKDWGGAILMDWSQLYIHPSDDTTEDDIRDFVEWVSRKAERLGFRVELKLHQKVESTSSETVSHNPLDKSNETY